jgi:hypothetical protein
VRLFTRLTGEESSPELLERLRRNAERHARLQKYEGALWMTLAVLLCVGAIVFFDLL